MRREHVDELLERDHHWELRFIRTLERRPPEVWPALTEADLVATWSPFALDGEVIRRDPPSRLELRLGGEEEVRFELEPAGADDTTLTVVHRIDDVGRAARDAAAWHLALERLAAGLEGREAPAPTPEDRRELFRSYARDFGPRSSTIAPA